MFWSKERTVQVRLINPPQLSVNVQRPEDKGFKAEDRPGSIHLDSVLKLAATIAVMINGALLTFGYMRYLALMELFGIARSEVSFTVSDLLAYGYGDVLNRIFSSHLSQAIFGATVAAIVMLLTALCWSGKTNWRRDVATMGIAMLLATLPAIPMVISYYPAKDLALALAAQHLDVEKEMLQKVKKQYEFDTPEGVLRGDLLLASPDYSYLLAGDVVYKIRTQNNMVVRRTLLKAVLRETNK